ncbi:MAG: acireductone synthase [Bacteriovoracaceae bacterium]|nr:acireductone synthase [Bacteriovoracaceae bacterium]
MKTLLFDIEGTTTDIHFVHKVLFPYSFEHIESYVRAHPQHPAIEEARAILKSEQNIEASIDDVIQALKLWITTDRKAPPLKNLQGEIWKVGYETNRFKGHVYPDVLPFWQLAHSKGYKIAIYSSGSVAAQKLIFKNSLSGDLTSLIADYFDTKVGHKREKESYLKIADLLHSPADDIVFFSDISEELDAAQAAGMQTVQLFREAMTPRSHKAISQFSEFTL